MSQTNFLIIWPEHPVLSLLLVIFITLILLYLARASVHNVIKSFSSSLYKAMRLASRSILLAEKKLVNRNREVLLASGREAVEKSIEREFQRVNTIVTRDLQIYPSIHRKLADQIVKIDEDYIESTDIPPSLPEWTTAIEAVANIPSPGDNAAATMLQAIHNTFIKHHKEAMVKYRDASSIRHSLLKKMMPYWRRLNHTLDEVGKTITGLQERSKVIDNQMAEYEEIRANTDKSVQMLSSSSMTQFVISSLVLVIAIAGAMINFNLIALPMSEMVGGGSYIGPFKTSNIAALVIILVETAMGIYLMESLRVTNLFPMIGTMDDKLRRRMVWVSFSLLLTLASVEAALAFMRDLIATDIEALRQSLAGTESTSQVYRWIPTMGQMLMGFVLPFALTFIAIPLESFVHSSRTVIGLILVGLLRGMAFFVRLLGSIISYLGSLLINIYDLLIFPCLWIEGLVNNKSQQIQNSPKEETT